VNGVLLKVSVGEIIQNCLFLDLQGFHHRHSDNHISKLPTAHQTNKAYIAP
jgi:hypothetical protein